MRIKLLGITIIVDFYFILLLSLGIVFDSRNISLLLLYSSLHELGHLLMLTILNVKPTIVRFSYYGLALNYPAVLSRSREVLVILAGPLINLLLFLLLKDDINLLLFTINMLPVYPIDFGRIIALYSYNLSKVISIIFLLILVVISLILLVIYHSFSLFFITCYLILYSINY